MLTEEEANKYKDVYGTMKKGSINLITVVLTILLSFCTVSNFFAGRKMWGIIFLFLLALLLISQFVSAKSTKAISKPEKRENKDAIFKDHEE